VKKENQRSFHSRYKVFHQVWLCSKGQEAEEGQTESWCTSERSRDKENWNFVEQQKQGCQGKFIFPIFTYQNENAKDEEESESSEGEEEDDEIQIEALPKKITLANGTKLPLPALVRSKYINIVLVLI